MVHSMEFKRQINYIQCSKEAIVQLLQITIDHKDQYYKDTDIMSNSSNNYY
jgi:hypothetical protein